MQRYRAVEVIGHAGAGKLAAPNTLPAIEAALEHGVDRLELDVFNHDGELVLAHGLNALGHVTPLTLADALARVGRAPNVGLLLDLKGPQGWEHELGEAIAKAGLAHRTWVCGGHVKRLPRVRAAAGAIRIAWSLPEPRGMKGARVRGPWYVALLTGWRWRLPGLTATAIRRGECDGLSCHWALVTPRLVRRVHREGGRVFSWTVDHPLQLRWIRFCGVDGVITNDPRLARGPAVAHA